MARMTGLEPATSGVTGRRSNQLSYIRIASRRDRLREAADIGRAPCSCQHANAPQGVSDAPFRRLTDALANKSLASAGNRSKGLSRPAVHGLKRRAIPFEAPNERL